MKNKALNEISMDLLQRAADTAKRMGYKPQEKRFNAELAARRWNQACEEDAVNVIEEFNRNHDVKVYLFTDTKVNTYYKFMAFDVDGGHYIIRGCVDEMYVWAHVFQVIPEHTEYSVNEGFFGAPAETRQNIIDPSSIVSFHGHLKYIDYDDDIFLEIGRYFAANFILKTRQYMCMASEVTDDVDVANDNGFIILSVDTQVIETSDIIALIKIIKDCWGISITRKCFDKEYTGPIDDEGCMNQYWSYID